MRHRIVISVGVSIIRLGIGGVWDDGVGAGETIHAGQRIAGIHIDEADIVAAEIVAFVAGKTHVGQIGCGLCPPVAEEPALSLSKWEATDGCRGSRGLSCRDEPNGRTGSLVSPTVSLFTIMAQATNL